MSNPSPLVIANLKANLSWEDVSGWLDQIGPRAREFKGTVVLCPSFPFLAAASAKIQDQNLKIKLGAQDVSKFETGSYTGEVAASQVAPICAFSIVGHSERKKYFSETLEDIVKKVEQLLINKITPILCVADTSQLGEFLQNESILMQKENILFVYEPPSAISGGGDYKPEDPNHASRVAGEFKEAIGSGSPIIYGGSINAQNAQKFFEEENISGGLIGQASLSPQSFADILETVN